MKPAFKFIESWILARQVSRWVPDPYKFRQSKNWSKSRVEPAEDE